MFDCLHTPGNAALDAVQLFFFDHGHELAEAARLLGGAGAEALVIACGARLETASRIDGRIRRDLAAIQRLLALRDVGDPYSLESALFSEIDPASKEAEMICLLTDRLEYLIDAIQPQLTTDTALRSAMENSSVRP